MATTMVSGNDGRVIVDSFTIATAKSWKLTKTTAAVPVPTFESDTQANAGPAPDLVYPDTLPGLSGATITLEGFFNTDATDKTDASFSNGDYVLLDLILVKGTPFGYAQIYALCTSFSPTTTIENQAAGFTAEFVAKGVVSKSGVVS